MKTIFSYLLALGFFAAGAQTTTFDNLNANPLTNKAITWTSSNYGSGFGHRIINSDPGYKTLLNFQGRHNSSSWSNIMTITSNGRVGIGIEDPSTKLFVSNGSSGGSAHSFSEFTIEDNDHGMMTILTPNNKNGFYGFADSNDDFVGGMQYDHSIDRL